jgi:hypothetical protein
MGLDFFGGILSAYGGFLIDVGAYLSGTQSPAPTTTGIQNPYTPPFSGGQCEGISYRIGYSGNASFGAAFGYAETTMNGAILAIQIRDQIGDTTAYSYFLRNSSGTEVLMGSFPKAYPITWTVTITRTDNAPDVCTNPYNPNPSVLNPDGGSVDSAYPTVEPSEIVPALLPVLAPSTVAAIVAALKNAANLAVLAANLADLLKYITDWIEERERNDPKKKKVVSRELGAIEKDGFLRFYPFARNGSQAVNLDVRFYQVPLWKKDTLLGGKSPNRYRELARILFVSETFGIIQEIDISYSINSIPIPESAIGFYYHLGLDGIAKAYTTAFYLE